MVLDGEKSYRQNKATGQKTRDNYEDGQYVTCTWAPSKESEVREEAKKVLKGNRFASLATESEEVFNRQG